MTNDHPSNIPDWLVVTADSARTSFRVSQRPEPVPVDLRRSWRLATLVLILESSRSNRASHKKLVLLNYALRSHEARNNIEGVLRGEISPFFLEVRVDPSLGRALDYGTGLGLMKRLPHARIELTGEGVSIAKSIWKDEAMLTAEKQFVKRFHKLATEGRVDQIL